MTGRRRGPFTSSDARADAARDHTRAPSPGDTQGPTPSPDGERPEGSRQRDAAPPYDGTENLDAETANAFLRRASEGFLVLDHDGLVRYANRRAQHLFGYSRDDLLGRPIELLLPGASAVAQDRPEAGEEDAGPNPAVRQELAARHSGGSTFPVEVSFSPLPPVGAARLLCVIEDRSERLGARRQLELTESRFETLFKASPAATYVWQRRQDEFYLMDFNDAVAGEDDSSIQHLLGNSLHEVYPEGSPVIDHVQQCFAQEARLVREIPDYRVRPTDQVKDLLVTYVFVPPDIVLAFVEDLTTQKGYERDLRKLSSAVEQTADTVFITDRSGLIEYVNPAFERTTGFSREEALGSTPRILKSGLQESEYYERLWGTILSGASFHATVINRRKNGELYHAEQTITPMKDAEGRIANFVSVLRDMTETIRLREQETESNLARKIQRRLFPAGAPRIAGFDIAGGVFPAAATCGDYFDFIPMAGGRLGVVVADACGHGMGPALIMAETRAYLHAAAPTESDPFDILERIHLALLADLDDRDYVTMIFACIDPKLRALHYASAGHVSALLLRPDGSLLRELCSTGRPLGAVPELAMERADPLALRAGNILVFLTDGILETDGPDAEEFGIQRTIEVVARNREAPAQQIVDRLHDEVLTFAGRASLPDDLTAVVCKVL
jgi:PAS domain S-box-containing protein